MKEEVNIYPCGIVVSPGSPWLAASPDRKVYCPSIVPPYGLLEIKCPVNSLDECVYLKKNENGSFNLKNTHMAVSGLEWCHFFVWTPEECHLELIRFDAQAWQKMKDVIDVFYFDYYL
jgi:hypothetical protein